MSIGFQSKVKQIINKISVKFTRAYLPNAKKPYYAKVVHDQRVDLAQIATSANTHNLPVSPITIEEGVNAFNELACYHLTQGRQVDTGLCLFRVRVPAI